MSKHEQDHDCAAIIKKIAIGQSLDPTEKTHLSQCVGCMREVVLHLDQLATTGLNKEETNTIPTRGGHSRTTALPDAVRLALEHGRQVLQREFGIYSDSKPGQPV